MELPELETWLISKFAEIAIVLDSNSNFFSSGVDSLKAIEMRGLILQNLDLGGNGSKLTSMVVYDCGDVAKLARHLYGIRAGEEIEEKDEIKVMEEMIERYSVLPMHIPGPTASSRTDAVVVSRVDSCPCTISNST